MTKEEFVCFLLLVIFVFFVVCCYFCEKFIIEDCKMLNLKVSVMKLCENGFWYEVDRVLFDGKKENKEKVFWLKVFFYCFFILGWCSSSATASYDVENVEKVRKMILNELGNDLDFKQCFYYCKNWGLESGSDNGKDWMHFFNGELSFEVYF